MRRAPLRPQPARPITATAIAGSLDARWVTIAGDRITLRDGDRVRGELALPARAEGPCALRGDRLAIGIERYDLVAEAWCARPAIEAAVLPIARRARPSVARDQLQLEVAGWTADALVAQVIARPPRDDVRWDPAPPTRWVVRLRGDTLELLDEGGRLLAPAQLAVAADAIAIGTSEGAVVWRDARIAITPDRVRACAFAGEGAIGLILGDGELRAHGVVDGGELLRWRGDHGPPTRLAGHARLPLLAWQAGDRVYAADLDGDALDAAPIDVTDRLLGWDDATATLLVASGEELRAWRWDP